MTDQDRVLYLESEIEIADFLEEHYAIERDLILSEDYVALDQLYDVINEGIIDSIIEFFKKLLGGLKENLGDTLSELESTVNMLKSNLNTIITGLKNSDKKIVSLDYKYIKDAKNSVADNIKILIDGKMKVIATNPDKHISLIRKRHNVFIKLTDPEYLKKHYTTKKANKYMKDITDAITNGNGDIILLRSMYSKMDNIMNDAETFLIAKNKTTGTKIANRNLEFKYIGKGSITKPRNQNGMVAATQAYKLASTIIIGEVKKLMSLYIKFYGNIRRVAEGILNKGVVESYEYEYDDNISIIAETFATASIDDNMNNKYEKLLNVLDEKKKDPNDDVDDVIKDSLIGGDTDDDDISNDNIDIKTVKENLLRELK